MTTWQTYLDDHQEVHRRDMLEFLSIPSISSLPEFSDDVHRAAEWVANRLRRAGLEDVAVLPTAVHPVVFGAWLHAPG